MDAQQKMYQSSYADAQNAIRTVKRKQLELVEAQKELAEARLTLKNETLKAWLELESASGSIKHKEMLTSGMVGQYQAAVDSATEKRNIAEAEFSAAKREYSLYYLDAQYWAGKSSEADVDSLSQYDE